MHKFIDTLRKAMPTLTLDQCDDFDKIPTVILAANVEYLMKIKGIKSNQALSDRICEVSKLELSKSQISRVRKMSSDATGLTVLKLGFGLCDNPEDYHYLYDINGFNTDGEAIGKYMHVNQSALEASVDDAYTSLSTEAGDVNVAKMIAMSLIGYRAAITNDYSTMQKEIMDVMKNYK